jgi:hypothetical protein
MGMSPAPNSDHPELIVIRPRTAFSFRWDSAEDVRYALLPGNPTDAAYKAGAQRGANRLAATGRARLSTHSSKRNFLLW